MKAQPLLSTVDMGPRTWIDTCFLGPGRWQSVGEAQAAPPVLGGGCQGARALPAESIAASPVASAPVREVL